MKIFQTNKFFIAKNATLIVLALFNLLPLSAKAAVAGESKTVNGCETSSYITDTNGNKLSPADNLASGKDYTLHASISYQKGIFSSCNLAVVALYENNKARYTGCVVMPIDKSAYTVNFPRSFDSPGKYSVIWALWGSGTKCNAGQPTGGKQIESLNLAFDVIASSSDYPVISNVAVNPQKTSVNVAWDTDKSADSTLYVWQNDENNGQKSYDDSMLTSHLQQLDGLTSNTGYNFRLYSKNAQGLEAKSSVGQFVTLKDDGTAGDPSKAPTPPANANQNGTPTVTPPIQVGLAPGQDINNKYDEVVGNVKNPIESRDLITLVFVLMKSWLAILGLLAVAVLIYGGFRMIASAGSEEAVTQGKKAITWAIIGLAVAILSFSIVSIVQSLLQAKPNLDLPAAATTTTSTTPTVPPTPTPPDKGPTP